MKEQLLAEISTQFQEMRLGRSLLFITLRDSFAEAGEVRAVTARVVPLMASPGRTWIFLSTFYERRKEGIPQLLFAAVRLLNPF